MSNKSGQIMDMEAVLRLETESRQKQLEYDLNKNKQETRASLISACISLIVMQHNALVIPMMFGEGKK